MAYEDDEIDLTCGEYIVAAIGSVIFVVIAFGSVVLGRGDLDLFVDLDSFQ